MYKLYRVRDRTKPCGTLACMYLGVDISPSTETLNFLYERNEPISVIKLVENYNLDDRSGIHSFLFVKILIQGHTTQDKDNSHSCIVRYC
jgi:hypothetical protein